MRVAIIYLLAVTVAELVTILYMPLWGILSHVAILITTLLHAALGFTGRRHQQQLVLSLALVPLVRVMSLSMPLVNIPPLWWYPLIYGPLLAAALVTTFIMGYKITDIGLNFKAFSVQFAVALTGFFFGVTEYFILKPSPLIAEFAWQEIWLAALVLLMTTGLVEEVIFRGVLQRTAVAVFKWRGIVYVSLLFAVLHMGFLSWLDIIFVFVVALFFGWTVTKTGSLVGVTLAHGITNSILFLVAPFVF